jgi:asparagine synthase (glutamine-hydrolysing)
MTVRDGTLTVRRYWHPERCTVPLDGPRPARIEQFRELFAESVRMRLRSDVPVGLFLSGGVDSSAIAAECCRQHQRLAAVTVTFDGDQSDRDDSDVHFARLVARHCDLDHQVIHTSGENVAEDFPQIIDSFDEPFADTSNVPSFYIARETSSSFKVVLNGDGGDEAFGGYTHYQYVAFKQRLKRLAALAGLCDGGRRDGGNRDCWQLYFQSKSLFRASARCVLSGGRIQAGGGLETLLARDPFLQACRPASALKMAMWADRHIYLSNDLLYKMDIALMSQGIEGRSPFLDHRLLEWAQQLPPRDLVWGRSKKNLLRDAFRRELPAAVLDRAKQGFGAPISRWLKGPLASLVESTLPTPLLAEKPQLDAVRAFAENRSGAAIRLWTLLVFALWARQWRATW